MKTKQCPIKVKEQNQISNSENETISIGIYTLLYFFQCYSDESDIFLGDNISGSKFLLVEVNLYLDQSMMNQPDPIISVDLNETTLPDTFKSNQLK